jgi:hypothetical protein
MKARYLSGGIHLDQGAPISPWPATSSVPLLTHTGDNSAGNGGNGQFSGSLVADSHAAFEPLNAAETGANATAHARQTNIAYFDQAATQIAGVGGDGGNGNMAHGGSFVGLGSIGSDVIATGGNGAGNGGDGDAFGSLVHTSFALYDPINIAVGGYNSSAHADQTNKVDFNQSAFQMAGVGGHGGNGNAALGGNVGGFFSDLGPIGSDVIATGANSAGNGGNGHFYGGLVDVNVAIYAPINIAVAGYDSKADAHQSNSVHFDQSVIQIAGVGGDGGHGNLGLGGEVALHLLADHHLLDYVG